MTMASSLLTSIIPPIVAVAGTVMVVKAVFPLGGKGSGKAVTHWHYRGSKGTGKAISHSHAGGGVSHRHTGMSGYGRKKSTLKR